MASTRRPVRLLAFRWHLMGLVAIALLPLVLFAIVLVGRSAREDRDEIEHELVERAEAIAAAVDREIAASLRAIETLARSEQLARGDLAGFRREALRVVEVQASWFALVLFTPDGHRVADTREDEPSGTTVDPVSFAEVLRIRQPMIGELVRARDGVTWGFAARAPVLDHDGGVRYVLTAALSAAEIGRLLSVGGATDVEWTRTVVDRNGTIVARTRDPQRWIGAAGPPAFMERVRAAPAGSYRDRSLEGVSTVVGYARAPLTGWTVAVVARAEALDGPVRRSTTLLALVGVASLVLSWAAAFLLSRRFARAVGSAADAAQALAAGGPAAVKPFGIREVARLGDALASSARLLEARREEGERNLAQAAEARRDAEASSRAKDEFLAMLGHELRNPLSPIVTALHLLHQRGTAWGREHEIISRQVGHLVRLVDDLLDVSRIARATIRLRPEQVDASSVVQRAVEMASPLLDERRHRLTLELERGLHVLADPVRLAQVMANLLTNAARYTPPGGHVRVVARREAAGVAIEVSDDGQGIAPDLLPRVFDLFVQGPRGADRAEGGLGIGLALVRSLVALHGGTVEARSAGPGRGSVFRVVLPPAPLAEGAPGVPLAAARAPARRPLRVLIVDDNADAAALLAELVTRAGHDVQVVHDGPAALTAAEASRPEVVVLDLGLPVMDGWEVATALHRRLGAAAPALVGVSGYGQERDLARSRAAGFFRHLVKPVDPADLLDALEEAGASAERRAPG
jgi:signal transduction histidine kinase/ActR/RegA family two-component response regulator